MHRFTHRYGIVLVAGIALLLLPSPALSQAPARAGAVIDSLARAALAPGEAAGMVVAVARGGEISFLRSYGWADLENDVPMTPQHVFPIASVTKQFTAAAVLILVEMGKVALDEPITTYLPDAPTQGRTISVRQLLSHTSGMQDITEMPAFRAVERLDLSPDSTLALVREAPLHFPPGEQMRYSNSGYLLLGMLIERVSGQTYEEFLVEHLFLPAGMGSSRYCDQRALIPRRASGYEYSPEGLVRPRFVSLRIPFSAGGICSTAGDLIRWNRALYGGKILSPAKLAEMVHPGTLNQGRPTRYGLGLAVTDVAGHLAFHHGGDIQGFTSYSAHFPDDSLDVIVLINTQGPVRPDALLERIAVANLGDRATPAPTLPASELARFAGEYEGGVQIDVGADGLQLSGGPRGRASLRLLRGTTFTDGQGLYTFEGRPDGGMTLWADLIWALVRWERR